LQNICQEKDKRKGGRGLEGWQRRFKEINIEGYKGS
jgi:hypothetical protein